MRRVRTSTFLFLVICLSLATVFPLYAQIDLGVVERSLSAIQARFDNLNERIYQLSAQILNLLQRDIDTQLRDELNEDLKELNDISDCLNNKRGQLYESEDRYKELYSKINGEIAAYYNRLAIQNSTKEEGTYIKEWSGTGFALNDGYVVTNNHVAENAKSIEIYGINNDFNTSYKAKIIGLDKNNDLALLRISDSSFRGFGIIPYHIKTSMAEVGESVFVLGYPLTNTMGKEIKLTNGIISSRTGYEGDVSLYQISAPIQSGNSGGPLFNSKGELIGIICAKHSEAENVGYAIKSTYLFNLVESVANESIIPRSQSSVGTNLKEQVKIISPFVFLIKCTK